MLIVLITIMTLYESIILGSVKKFSYNGIKLSFKDILFMRIFIPLVFYKIIMNKNPIYKYPIYLGCFIEVILEDSAYYSVHQDNKGLAIQSLIATEKLTVSLDKKESIKRMDWILKNF